MRSYRIQLCPPIIAQSTVNRFYRDPVGSPIMYGHKTRTYFPFKIERGRSIIVLKEGRLKVSVTYKLMHFSESVNKICTGLNFRYTIFE